MLQCDVVNCGGFTGAKKIAALAEAYYVPMAPHNPNGPIATLAAAHLLSAIPNALILETVGSEVDFAMFAEIVDRPPRPERGILRLDDTPGIGARSAGRRDDATAGRPLHGDAVTRGVTRRRRIAWFADLEALVDDVLASSSGSVARSA